MQEAPGVRIIRNGRRTYFIDSKKTKEGKGYLMITESKLVDFEKKLHDRSRIVVFPEIAKDFAREVAEAIKSF
ncbi:MAG: hypothetical protein UW69_C0017G0004 [Microgenomates group bacterium GW2011_GWA2_44_7]|nr:MAG: hypothetical protein UW69_C0017G0004 [Microgenomates group bacterium GW2011_GWA2_44_7]KKT78622.1 MAG: hypothetical protein UW73_C0001G0069 [Microgenomates group bacterium GW2011_GWB1_44_8]